ncbi:hypothetical protein [Streptomyces sp. NPDC050504]|uniref:hypothetical protein n=1 Tax=Streptomyces sp. NPDC050504 TaxID=3365618 RepID=UPI00379B723F
MDSVRAVLSAVREAGVGGVGGEVPLEDVRAALTQLARVREDVDVWELALIEAAQARGASLSGIAADLGMTTRQSAESRKLSHA